MLENIEITGFAAEGKSIARVNDMVVFVPWVVPGDVCDLQVTRKKHSFMEARVAIEGAALRRLAERRTEEDLVYLEEIIARADALLKADRPDDHELAEVLFRFHRGICLRSGNEFFPLLLNEFRPIIMEFWLRSIAMFGAEANVHLAKRYLDYIRAGDAEGAFRRLQRSVNEYLNCLDGQIR